MLVGERQVVPAGQHLAEVEGLDPFHPRGRLDPHHGGVAEIGIGPDLSLVPDQPAHGAGSAARAHLR
ncbi:hypothetical protein [Elioraea thermophila]|uniref:hypothetical protein n=1 Tax=Elioraea thermophila TaxID=2185104 RepID=UPI000DF49FC9|nr:hypothetical protein [Elioraea thermophila]